MGNVKEAFKRVKQDISSLKDEINYLKSEISGLRESLNEIRDINYNQKNTQNTSEKDFDTSTHSSTDRHINSTDSTHPSTDNTRFKPLNGQNLGISTGNKGVSTDRQTHRQTHRQQDYTNFRQGNSYQRDNSNSHPPEGSFKEGFDNKTQENNTDQDYVPNKNNCSYTQGTSSVGEQYKSNQEQAPSWPYKQHSPQEQFNNPSQGIEQGIGSRQIQQPSFENKKDLNQEQSTMNNALEILNSLDSLKKEIRFKFKKLTDQEMTVFSTLYQLNEENEIANYKTISRRLNLSESSIRDYMGRLMKKGIPIEKERINNKTIHLNISQELKKVATLPTILKLRDL